MSCLFGYVCDMHVEQQSVVLNGHVNEVSFCKHHTNVHWTFGGRSFACKRIKHNGRAPLNSISSLHGSMLAKTGAFNGYSSVTCQSWAKVECKFISGLSIYYKHS